MERIFNLYFDGCRLFICLFIYLLLYFFAHQLAFGLLSLNRSPLHVCFSFTTRFVKTALHSMVLFLCMSSVFIFQFVLSMRSIFVTREKEYKQKNMYVDVTHSLTQSVSVNIYTHDFVRFFFRFR